MALERATFAISEDALELMALDKQDLPSELSGLRLIREGALSNDAMAEHGFPGNTPERLRGAGRISGYTREFGETSNNAAYDGFNFVAATVAHLFDNPDTVSSWMTDIFIRDFESNVGESLSSGQQLISVTRLEPQGFFDEAVALRVLQGGQAGLMSSTVIDFRVGRILGVAFTGTVGDHERLDLTTQLALALEKRIVQVVLGGG